MYIYIYRYIVISYTYLGGRLGRRRCALLLGMVKYSRLKSSKVKYSRVYIL